MGNVPSRVATRLANGLKKFQPVLAAARSRDINESDTVIVVMDMLQEVFGYDKYTEITSEHMIRGTFCDLALKLDGGLQMLIEVKAIGLELRDAFLKQAVDYAANQGTDWVVLELLWLLAKEGWQKARLGEYHTQRQALSRFFLGAVIQTDPVLDVIRRELRRVSPGVKIETDEIRAVLGAEVLKREVLEGEKAAEAKRQLARASARSLRARKEATDAVNEQPGPDAAEDVSAT